MQKLRATLFWGPYNKDPTILGCYYYIRGTLKFGNLQKSTESFVRCKEAAHAEDAGAVALIVYNDDRPARRPNTWRFMGSHKWG